MFQQQPLLWLQGQPHSTEHGSVKDELVARASHTHALFHDDNATVYHHLEETTRSRLMLPLSNPTNMPRMVGTHGLHLLASLLGLTSGKLKSRNRNNSSTHMCVEGAVQLLFGKFHISTFQCLMCPCRPALNMLSINFQMSTLTLVFSWRQSKTLTLDCKLQWLVYKQTLVMEGSEANFRRWQHIFCCMTLWPRSGLPTPSNLILLSLMLRGPLSLWLKPMSMLTLVRLVCIFAGTLSLSMPNCLLLGRKNFRVVHG